jgi:outer membrane protein TolC
MKTLFVTAIAGLACACATYTPASLPKAEIEAQRPGPDLDRLRIAAAKLAHPILDPIEINLEDGLSPAEAAVLAVLANPDLAAARDAHGQAAAQLISAGLLPNPKLAVGVDAPFGAGSQGTQVAANLSLEFDIKSLIGRAARVAEAGAQIEAIDLGIAWQEWQVAQAARLAAVRLAMLERRLALIGDELNFEAKTLAIVAKGVAQGDATLQDLGIHRSALETLRGLAGELARSREDTRSQLNLLLGLPPDKRIPVTEPDESFNPLPPAQALILQAVTARLDLVALRLGYRAQEARVRQAVLAQFPSLSVGISGTSDETALKFLGGFINLSLPIFDRAQGRIATERASRKRLRHEYRARIAHVRAQVARLVSQDALLAEELEATRQGAGKLEDIESRERQGVSDGDVSRLAWQELRGTLFDIRLRLASLLQARMETRIALATALGGKP